MKFVAIATAAAFATVAYADTCDVSALEPLMSDSDTQTCVADSGVAMEEMNDLTTAEMDILCTNAACQSFVAQMKELAPSECTMGSFSLYAGFITPLEEYCSNSSSSGSSATSNTGSSTSATVTASSTGSTAATTTTTSSGSAVATATSSSAASASKSGSSGASMAAVSAGAVLVAIAATFF